VNPLPTAVFLDRDGTIVEDAHYLSSPGQLRLIDGAAEAIARINAALVPVIVVTNQSGIGREFLTEDDHRLVSERLDEMLGEHGARIDDSYFCPHVPEYDCDCRKPRTLLFRTAQREHPEIDLARSLYIGDRLRDVEPAFSLGGSGVLIPSPETSEMEKAAAEAGGARIAPSLGVAVDWYLCTN
jgi:D-glycero-D-manno-heptose 1,7-bisphosphate phosphatase